MLKAFGCGPKASLLFVGVCCMCEEWMLCRKKSVLCRNFRVGCRNFSVVRRKN